VIVHLYHCNRAVIVDKPGSVGRNRPANLRRFPPRPGLADFVYEAPTDGFEPPALGDFLALLKSVDPRADNAVLKVDWGEASSQLGISETAARKLLDEVYARHLIRGLTVDVDHNRWMKVSDNKGCLVVMACVEATDRARDVDEITGGLTRVVEDCVVRITNDSQWIDAACLVPNVHLAPREPAPDDGGEHALSTLLSTRAALESYFDFDIHLASFGYSKIIDLAINAHPVGFQIRAV
jgi:DNA-binding Lrp family transcriptional regulator